MDFQEVIYGNVEKKNIHFTTDISIFTLGNEKKNNSKLNFTNNRRAS